MGKKETKIDQESRLSDPLRRPAIGAVKGAGQLYESTEPYPSAYVPISAQRRQGLEQAQALASGGARVQPGVLDEYLATLQGDYLSPDTNPYLDEMVQRSVQQAQGAVNRGTGRYGSGGWASAMADATQGTAARLYSAAYEAERNRMADALRYGPAMSTLEYAPSSEIERIGAAYEMDEAAQQAEDMRQFMWPYQKQSLFESSLAGSPLTAEYNTKQTVTELPDKGQIAASVVGSLLGGLGGGLLGGVGGALGGAGGGFGGGGGGFGGASGRYQPTPIAPPQQPTYAGMRQPLFW